MQVIIADNVNEALHKGLALLQTEGRQMSSRNGDTLEIPEPVSTVYVNPLNRVLLSQVRDCNPFFHLMESLWILNGRRDVSFLAEFNRRMSDYSDDKEVFNAPYGYRMRKGVHHPQDQIETVVEILKKDPNSRQAVIQIWSELDLSKVTVDKACNMQVVFRVRDDKLDMTVYNRSNDVIWGAYGANVVQFSMLMEYVAAKTGYAIGRYTHVSNSYHVYISGPGGKKYEELMNGFYGRHESFYYKHIKDYGISPTSIFQQKLGSQDIAAFDSDLARFFKSYDSGDATLNLGKLRSAYRVEYESDYFNDLVRPMLLVWITRKMSNPNVETMIQLCDRIYDDPWKIACKQWILNRVDK